MRNLASRVGLFAIVGVLALGSSGCIKKMLMKGQIEGTLKGSEAVSTVSDYEVAKYAALAGLAKAEGLHYLAPDIERGLYLLLKSWAGASFAFIEDEYEQAEDLHGEDSELAAYHKARAVAGYARAIHYGSQLLEARNPGFKNAQKGADSLKVWLQRFTEPALDAPYLFWTGQAWLSRINLLAADDISEAASLYVGEALVRRSVELDEKYNYGTGHVILGALHGRNAGGTEEFNKKELAQSKVHFDRAMQINGGKALLTKYNLAVKLYCPTRNKAEYVKTLTEVIEAGDVLPEQRLQNTIAKRRARRYLSAARMERCAFD